MMQRVPHMVLPSKSSFSLFGLLKHKFRQKPNLQRSSRPLKQSKILKNNNFTILINIIYIHYLYWFACDICIDMWAYHYILFLLTDWKAQNTVWVRLEIEEPDLDWSWTGPQLLSQIVLNFSNKRQNEQPENPDFSAEMTRNSKCTSSTWCELERS